MISRMGFVCTGITEASRKPLVLAGAPYSENHDQVDSRLVV